MPGIVLQVHLGLDLQGKWTAACHQVFPGVSKLQPSSNTNTALASAWCLLTTRQTHLAVIYHHWSKLFLGFRIVEGPSSFPYLDQESLPLVEIFP